MLVYFPHQREVAKPIKRVPCEYHISGLWRTLNILYIKLSRKRIFASSTISPSLQHIDCVYIVLLYKYMYVGNILRVLREDNECVRWDCLGLAGIADALPSQSQKSNNSRSFARTSQNSEMLLFFFNKICFN